MDNVTLSRVVSWLVAIIIFSNWAVAQEPMTTRPQVEEHNKSGVFLDVVVTPKNGSAPLAGLTRQDFTITDNQAPQAITGFQAMGGSEAPVAVTVVLDTVNAPYMKIAFERNEIERFFKANNGNMTYPTQLAIFTDTGTQIQGGFTKDGNALRATLDHDVLRNPGFYDSVERLQLSIRTLEQLTQREATVPGRKLVLWVSPGWPILEEPNVIGIPPWTFAKQQQGIFDAITGLSTALREARVTLYCIEPLGIPGDGGFLRPLLYKGFLKGVRRPGQTEFGDLALQVISTQTGGLVLNSRKDLAALLDQAVADSNAFYQLAFDPGMSEPDEYHQIEVKVGKPGLIARTRTGYYSGE